MTTTKVFCSFRRSTAGTLPEAKARQRLFEKIPTQAPAQRQCR